MGRHYEHGTVLFSMRRYADAIDAFSQDLAAEPENAHALAMRAASWVNSGSVRKAAKDVANALRVDPNLAYSHYVLSYVRSNQGRMAEAEAASREALRIAPTAGHHFRLAEILFARHQLEQSLRVIDQGLALDPTHLSLLLLRAKLLSAVGRQTESLECMKSALAQDPQDSQAHHTFGALLLNAGSTADAKEFLREARRLSPVAHNDRDSLAAAYGRLLWPLSVIDRSLIRYGTWTPRRRWFFLVSLAALICFSANVFTGAPWLTLPFFLLAFNLMVAPLTIDLFATPLGKIVFHRDLDIPWYYLPLELIPLVVGLNLQGLASAMAVVCAFAPVFASLAFCVLPNLELIFVFIRKPTLVQQLLYGSVAFCLVVFPIGMAVALMIDPHTMVGGVVFLLVSLFFSYLLTVHWR